MTQDWISSQDIVQWQPTARVPELPAEGMHVWWAPLDVGDRQRERLASSLAAAEQSRADRFRLAAVRNNWIVGRATLRSLLSAYLQCPPQTMSFETGSLGKPALAESPDKRRLCFNYSDSGGRALYAFSWNRELGVDLEYLPREVHYDRIVRRRFTPIEADAILTLPSPQRRDAFLACWTRKEGYGKAIGMGIRYPLDSIELCRDCRDPELFINGGYGTGKSWQLQQIYPSADFVGTVVYERGDRAAAYYGLDHAILADPSRA